jgi:thiol-disulfide isomerase/thioredoxin
MPKNLRRICFVWLILVLSVELWGQHLKEIPPYAPKRGDQAPPLGLEFVLQGPKPTEVNWEALRGTVVVLDFWGTWCAPCVAGIPHLNELASHCAKKPVQFIAVGHENPRKVTWFLQRHRIDAWIALDTDLSVYKDYAAFGIPYAVVVDQNGRVAAVLNPKDLSEAVIDAVLAGRVPAYPALTADNYWEPEMAAKYFLQVGREEPPTK